MQRKLYDFLSPGESREEVAGKEGPQSIVRSKKRGQGQNIPSPHRVETLTQVSRAFSLRGREPGRPAPGRVNRGREEIAVVRRGEVGTKSKLIWTPFCD